MENKTGSIVPPPDPGHNPLIQPPAEQPTPDFWLDQAYNRGTATIGNTISNINRILNEKLMGRNIEPARVSQDIPPQDVEDLAEALIALNQARDEAAEEATPYSPLISNLSQ
ncbi:MAG: hypothetical protein LBF22_05070 [Deltaproteobacteria bacterium]|nr:hypothetical protein [Deltaproteobacteria bacterium]